MPNEPQTTKDPRVDPVGKFICELFGDSWTPNKQTYRAWAKRALKIADDYSVGKKP